MAKNEVVATLKKVKSAKPKNPKTAPQHPKVAEMVNTAISTLKDRRGSSLQAIKKYIASQYKVDVQKISPLISKYLKNSVESGTLIQTKGKGASGSFKMASQTSEKEKPKSAAPKAKKAAKPKTPKKASPTKNPKESKTMKPKAKKAAKPKTPKKASPTKNPKESKTMKPKAKKAAKPKTPKKASPTKNPKESKTMKPKAKKISGIMSCRGSMFAPRRFEIMKVE